MTHFRWTPLGISALLLLGAGCGSRPTEADLLIDRVIAAHGMERLDNAEVRFVFRGDRFVARRQHGTIRYERYSADSTGSFVDVLTNDGLYRERNGVRVDLTAEEYARAETTLNSVIYFALLPLPLRDAAVRGIVRDNEIIRGSTYHVLDVVFDQDGGGRDWEDTFRYWIHSETGLINFLAYSFHVNDGGTRFREAYNPRRVEGVLFLDYRNYTDESIGTDIAQYAGIFDSSQASLQLFSDIVLEDIDVEFF
jgi:hypothetical protein